MKIAVVGSGYVGLVAGACFADSGTNVMCIDVNEAKLAKLRAGEVPFFEPRLADLLKRKLASSLGLHVQLARRHPRSRSGVRRRRHAAARRRLRRPFVRARRRRTGGQGRGARDRAGAEEYGAGRHQRQGARGGRALRQAQDQRREQPGVLEGGRRGERLLQAGPNRDRHRRQPRLRALGASCTHRTTVSGAASNA